VSDTKSELGTVLIYITLINLLERTDINLRLCRLIPLGVLRILDKL